MDDALLRELGAAVRAARGRRGMSLRLLADRCGLSVRFLSDLEGGKGNASVLSLARVGRALGTSAGALLRRAEEAAEGGSRRGVVALLGLRGAGKSTIGGRLAYRLKLPFFELDGLVEAAAGLSLAEVFALHGEAYYRRLELEVLRRFLEEHDAAVLATGGGIVAHEEAFSLLQERTETVWLRADAADHWDRVVSQGDVRPMAGSPAARAELGRILAEREPRYARARHRIDTSRLGVKGAVDAVIGALGAVSAAKRSEPTKGSRGREAAREAAPSGRRPGRRLEGEP